MQTFDLEKALAGAPLVTRDGRKATEFREAPNDDTKYRYRASIAGRIIPVNAMGEYSRTEGPDQLDLFLDIDISEKPDPGTTALPENIAPFDLEKALAGHPLITRAGERVTRFSKVYTPPMSPLLWQYIYEVGNNTVRYISKKGTRSEFPEHDLFLDLSRIAKLTQPLVKEYNKTPPANILEEAAALIYGDREADYGSVTENFGNIAKGWSVLAGTEITPEQVGLMMVWLKISRQVNKPKHDNLVDAAGYIGCIDKIQKGL